MESSESLDDNTSTSEGQVADDDTENNNIERTPSNGASKAKDNTVGSCLVSENIDEKPSQGSVSEIAHKNGFTDEDTMLEANPLHEQCIEKMTVEVALTEAKEDPPILSNISLSSSTHTSTATIGSTEPTFTQVFKGCLLIY